MVNHTIDIDKQSFLKNCFNSDEYDQVISYLEEKIKINAKERENYWYLGLAYLLKEEAETAQSIWMSLLLDSDDFEFVLHELLEILDQEGWHRINQKKLDSALVIYTVLDELLSNQEEDKPEYGNYYLHLGILANAYWKVSEAVLLFERAIRVNNNNEAYSHLASIYYLTGELNLLADTAQRHIKAHSHNIAGYFNLMASHEKAGNIEKAREAAQIALEKFPDDLSVKIRKDLILPSLYRDEQEIKNYRKQFAEGLDKIYGEFAQLDLQEKQNKNNALIALENNANFELAYQCFNHKNLQKKYGDLVYLVMAASFPEWVKPLSVKPITNRKLKIGYLSFSMKDHIVSKLTLGWLSHHNQDKFQVYSYYIGDKYDFVTTKYRENSYSFFHNSKLKAVCQQIINDDLDILVFLEIGMNSKMALLGSLRLAPIQCTTWAHPETSGLKNIDYFLSSELMEPENGQEHYTEQLIRLPNIGVSYSFPPLPEVTADRGFFNLPENVTLYCCTQTLYKYLPHHDYIFPAIAKKVAHSKFVFLARPNPYLAKIFQDRLRDAFSAENLDFDDYCIFLSPLSHPDYLNLNRVCDVFLDTLGWSGGGTTLDALACNLPVVTYPGEFMRGRHSYGILKMLGVTDTIASSEQEYIDIAVRLGVDQLWKEEIREKIKANHHRLYDDLECVKGLEKFYLNVVKELK